MLKLTFIILAFISTAFAQPGPINFCTEDLETFPVLAGGREKPLYVVATETMKFMTGSEKIQDLSATEAFCKLSLKAFGMPTDIPVSIKVDHVDVRKLLGMEKLS